MTTPPIPPTLGLVLAGGLARRMGGGDKARIEINGITILDRVLATLSAQCPRMIINANGDPKRFADTGLPVISDNVSGHPGPLAGVLAGLGENGVKLAADAGAMLEQADGIIDFTAPAATPSAHAACRLYAYAR